MNIDGVLTIRTIDGSNTPFNVGRLITDLQENICQPVYFIRYAGYWFGYIEPGW